MVFLDALAAFFIGTLSGMGIGGGGLLVIYLTLLRGFSQLSSQGINLYFFIFASVSALFVHFSKRKIDPSLILSLALFGIPSALLGSLLAREADPAFLRRAFGLMLILGGGISLISPIWKKRKKENEKK